MSKLRYGKLNHNRYIDNGAKDIAEDIITEAEREPTAKQKKFFLRLVMMCKEHDLDPATGHRMKSRTEYADGIDTLIKKLEAKGVEVRHNHKKATRVLVVGEDERGRLLGKEKLVIEDDQPKPAKDAKINKWMQYAKWD